MSFEILLSPKMRTIYKLKKSKSLNLVADYYKKVPRDYREKLEVFFTFVDDDLQKLLSYVYNVFETHQSVFIAIEGRQGIGKTVSQYYLRDILGFRQDFEIVYTRDQLDILRDEFPTRKFIMFPDMSMLFTSRNWDKHIQEFTNTLRAFENVYCLSIPYFEEMDKAFRLQFDISELEMFFDRRILKIDTAGRIFRIVVPSLETKVIEKIHELDLKYKRKRMKTSNKN